MRKKVLVSGRVQGVFYRATARVRAQELGVAGSAKNRPDGRVELILEGDAHAVEEMIAWARQGPGGARVEDVEVSDEPVAGIEGFAAGDF